MVCMHFSYCLFLNQIVVQLFLQLSEFQAVIVLDLHKLDMALLIIQEMYIIMAPPLTAAG